MFILVLNAKDVGIGLKNMKLLMVCVKDVMML